MMSNRVKHIHRSILPKINSFLSNKFTNISSQIHPQWQPAEEQVPDNSLTSGGKASDNRGLAAILTSNITGTVYDFFNFALIDFKPDRPAIVLGYIEKQGIKNNQ